MAHGMEPPQPPMASRPALTCERHPSDSFTGFCASCLRERLQTLETTSSTSTTHRNSTSTISSSLKSIFLKPPPPPNASELRRCKSFSFSAPRISASFEPQRRSCDVRGRNTLWSLFNQDDSDKIAAIVAGGGGGEIEEEARDEITALVDPLAAVDPTPEEVKPMKEHIDLEAQTKKQSASTFWLAASVFSKKLQKWRRKQKMKKVKKHEDGKAAAGSKSARRFHETQSEIAVDAFGRRSCDFAPRFSLDAGRFSFDDPRYSIDEPRASWDGFLIGNRPRLPPMLSVVEDVVPADPVIQRSDGQIPVEEDLVVPGNSQQTKDYYSDSSSKSRRRSLDRSSSVKKVSAEINENEFVRDWSSNSFRDYRSESFESAYREDFSHKLPPRKKSKRWSKAWSIWGFIHRRSTSSRAENAVERSFSEVWPNGYASGRILRSNSNVSSRSSMMMRKNGFESNGIGKKRRDEFVFERNRSVRYSPGRLDNGMLRFYLTPMKGSRRGSSGMMGRHSSGYNSFTRSMLGLQSLLEQAHACKVSQTPTKGRSPVN